MSTQTRPWGHALELRGRVRWSASTPPLTADGPAALRLSPNPVVPGGIHADDGTLFVYPWEHYTYWADRLGQPLPEGFFGEHLTTVGLLEDEVFVGDSFSWGAASLQVRRPGPARLAVSLLDAPVELGARTGFWLSVCSGGTVAAGDDLRLTDVDPVGLSVATVARVLSSGPEAGGVSLERVLLARHLLPVDWVQAQHPSSLDDTYLEPPAAG